MSHKHKEEKQIVKSVLDALLSQMPFSIIAGISNDHVKSQAMLQIIIDDCHVEFSVSMFRE